MQGEKTNEHLSSWLVNPGFIITWLVFYIISVIYERSLLSIFFLILFFITVLSRVWSKFSLEKLLVSVTVSRRRLFKGQELIIDYCLENQKFWPLIWVKWMQRIDINPVLSPPDEDVIYVNMGGENIIPYYVMHLSWIMWFHKIKWQSIWAAKHRGVYEMSNVNLSSGDGFGLSAVERKEKLPEAYEIVVYPALIPVQLNVFDSTWGIRMGSAGFIEDTTLIRGIRDFRAGDPWKRINWRLAAQQKPLQVNFYEKVNYQPVHFIIDVQSFMKSKHKYDDFEDALSILASILVALNDKKVDIGLSLPASLNRPVQHFVPKPDEDHLLELLKALAVVSLEESRNLDENMYNMIPDGYSERVYFITFDLNYKNLAYYGRKNWTILLYEDTDESSIYDSLNILSMKKLKQE